MEHALYDPDTGYYARAEQRSGRAGDFFTSVDVGSTFGELLELQVAEMAELLPDVVDLVEVGAGNGRLSADILAALSLRHPSLLARLRLHLVEASASARAAHRDVLGEHADLLVSSSASLPNAFGGILIANELLDAMPVHQVVMREEGLREVYVDLARETPGVPPELITREGPPSTPALAQYLARAGATLQPGWRAEINLRAIEWIMDAARRLQRGFMILIDYGHEARELYSASHAGGTLTTFTGHQSEGPESPLGADWLFRPGEQDITAHVDFTSFRREAEAAGLVTLGLLDQTYFLMGLLDARELEEPGTSMEMLKRRLALKTLLLPGGLGSTMKVLLLGKNVGAPRLRGCSYRVRMT
jgi:SAM-dependent MidA family methyltransferase